MVEVLHGDCIEILEKGIGTFDFVFCDPPFNIGQEYEGFEDRMTTGEYRGWVRRWTGWVMGCLTPGTGVAAFHGPDDLAEIYIKKINGDRIAWVNWHYRFGQCRYSNWIDARCHCLIYVPVGQMGYKWNPEAVAVESDRVKYGDRRVNDTERGGKRVPGTVWGIPSDGKYWGRVTGNSKERRQGHPNQLPEVYLERLIKAYTDPGDRILDPFGGSGTTAVVAQALGRDCVTIDVSKANCERIKERLKKGAVRV